MLDNIRTVPVVPASELEANAHATFVRYRSSYPFIAIDSGGYVVLRYEDVSRLMSDPRLQGTETAMPAQGGILEGALFDIFAHGVLTANGDTHQRRRSALSRALAHEAVEHFRQHVRSAAMALIDERIASGQMEVASDYAARLPLLALAGLLGIPDEDVSSFTQDILLMDEFFRPGVTPDAVAGAEQATLRLRAFLDALLTKAEAEKPDGFMGRYLRLADEDHLTRIEVLVQIVQLIIGGTESVRTSLVAQLAHLWSYPRQWQAVCEDVTLVRNAVAEAMRFEPGIAGVVRVSVEDIEMDGFILPAGQLVILSSMSALRDERIFEHADLFDISRTNLKLARLAFGGGSHRCVADAFGWAELEEGLSVLVERLPGLTINSMPAFEGHMFVRRTTECRISW